MSLKVFNQIKKLREYDIIPLAVKTDCIYILPTLQVKKKIRKEIPLGFNMGEWKIIKSQKIPVTLLKQTKNELVSVINVKINQFYIKDEYDQNKFNQIFDKNNIQMKKLVISKKKASTLQQFIN
jgi:hypothetical protein